MTARPFLSVIQITVTSGLPTIQPRLLLRLPNCTNMLVMKLISLLSALNPMFSQSASLQRFR